MSTKNKAWNEDFAKFFSDPSREKLRDLLKNNVGELDSADFKKDWPVLSKVARHILGLANSGGGCLFVGIEEKDDKTFEPIGVDELLDKADLQKGIQKFIPAQIKYQAVDFPYDHSEYDKLVGKKFQIVFVDDMPEYIPFISRANGEGIKENTIYVRRGTNTDRANYEELQEILNRRIETGYSSQEEFDFNKHLSELRALYDQIPRNISSIRSAFPRGLFQENPEYPKEDFEEFIRRMIEMKKDVIKSITSQK